MVKMPPHDDISLDAVDLRLVRALERDGRRSNVDLARDLGVSEKTIRNRIKRLVDHGGLRISAHMEQRSAAIQVIFLIHAAPGRRFALGERLSECPEVTEVLLANGAAELIVHAHFTDDDQALRFLVETIEASPDVRDSAACSIISRVGSHPRSDADVPPILMNELVDAVLNPPKHAGINETMTWICTTMKHCFSADHAAAIVYDPDHNPSSLERRQLLSSATVGLSEGFIGDIADRLRRGSSVGVVQHAFSTRQHVFVDNALTSPLMNGAQDVIRREGYQSMITFPMLFGSTPFGACMLYFDDHITIDETFVGSAQKFVDQCAVLIARIEPSVIRQVPGVTDGAN